MKTKGWATLLAMTLAGCGGGGGGDGGAPKTGDTAPPPVLATTLSGVVAAGAPLSDAVVQLIDANGLRALVNVAADGSYRFDDVSGFKPPFVLRALGSVGGEPVALHAPVLASDTAGGVVNVTPLTDVMLAAALGAAPDAAVDSFAADSTRLTDATVKDAQATVRALVNPVLNSLGVGSDIDLRKSAFTADHSGLDRVLDALKVEPTGAGYRVTTVAGGSSTEIGFGAAAQAGTPLAFTSTSVSNLLTALQALPALQARLKAFTGLFAAGVPAAADIKALFGAGFLHTGLDADGFAAFLRQPVYAKAVFDNPRILAVIDDSHLIVNYRVRFDEANKTRPINETMRMQRLNGRWQFVGDGELAAISLSFESRLGAAPLAEAQLAALSNVKVSTYAGSAGEPHTFYTRNLMGASGQVEDELYLGEPGSYDFGFVGFLNANTTTPEGREAWRLKSEHYAKPNAAIEQYFIPAVLSDRVSPQAATIELTGPGLPAAGLTLVPPRPNRPRYAWVFKGDSFDWTAFNTERCVAVNNAENPVADCAFDMSKVHTGSEYVFKFRDAAGEVIGEMRRRLPSKPAAPSALLKNKDAYFARFQLDAAQRFTLRNLHDTTGAFRQGAPLVLRWSYPSNPKVFMHGASFATYFYDEQNVQHDAYRWDAYRDSDRQSAPFSVERGYRFGGAYGDVEVFDHFGNTFKHEVNYHNVE